MCKSFGSFVVLKDVNFYVYPGETLCILGRSGVGKSVSLQMLMGFLKPDKGTIRVAGQDIAGFYRSGDAGSAAQGDDGVQERRAVSTRFR